MGSCQCKVQEFPSLSISSNKISNKASIDVVRNGEVSAIHMYALVDSKLKRHSEILSLYLIHIVFIYLSAPAYYCSAMSRTAAACIDIPNC